MYTEASVQNLKQESDSLKQEADSLKQEVNRLNLAVDRLICKKDKSCLYREILKRAMREQSRL